MYAEETSGCNGPLSARQHRREVLQGMLTSGAISRMASQQLFHKTRAQLRPWDTSDLQALDNALHALLEGRTREDAAPLPVTPGRTVVAERRQGTVTLRLAYVRCDKASCHCAHDTCHGPS